MAVDGSLTFDTKIEIDGFNKGTGKVIRKTKETSEQVISESEKTNKRIQDILDDATRSMKSKAASIAAIYRKQGLNQQEAMQKAWDHIERNSADANDNIVRQNEKTNTKIKLAAKNTSNALSQSYSGMMTRVSSVFKRLAIAAATAFSVTKLVQFGQQAIETASDMAEVQNVVDTAFGNMSSKMEKFADTAIETYGISKLTAKQTGSTYMAMAKGMNIADESASDMAIALTGLSADMASFYNVEQDVASTALNSIFTGETETLKKFGIVMTETNLSAFAMSQGITKNISDMTQAEKVQLRYQYVMAQTSLAQGDFARTSNGWANQTRMLSQKFEELSSIVGQVLMNVILPAVQMLNNGLSVLIEYATEAYNALSKLFGWEEIGASQGAGQLATDVLDSTLDTAEAEKAVTKATKDTNKERERGLQSFDKLNVMQDNSSDSNSSDDSPVKLADTAGATAGATVANSTKKAVSNGLSNAFKDLYKKSGLAGFIRKIKEGIKSIDFKSIVENFKSIFNSLKPIASSAFKGIQNVGKSVFEALGSYIKGVVIINGKSLQTLSGGIAKWLKQDSKKISDFIDTFSTNISKGFENLSKFFDSVFGTAGESIDRMRPVMEEAIAKILSGFTGFQMSIDTITSGAFSVATENLAEWAENSKEVIGTTLDNIQDDIAQSLSFVGTIFGDIGTILSDWWNNGGSEIFDNVCKAFLDIGTTLMNVYNEWVKPAIDFIFDILVSAWDNALKPIFEKVISFSGKLCDCVATIWNNFLSPFVNWIIKILRPHIITSFNAIKGVFDTVFGVIGDVIGGLLEALGGLLDFITGVFSGDWEKAWNGIKQYYEGTWKALWGIVKSVINLIIDGINILWSGIFLAVKGMIDSIGKVSGAIGDLFGQDWHFSTPESPPLIPKLATGTVVPANYGEFTAILGDNKREPEVVSPLSTMKQAVMEAFAEQRINGGADAINLTINLDGNVIFKDIIKRDKAVVKRTGKSAFAY
ncbi:MAG: hypothetical protein ACI4RM_02905 [Ruminococcus sp.]